ncbi:MAG: TIGR03667 family PPOX class F420-dependent oxidoreductase [Ktedonobacteraceae bacterium]
MVSVLDLTQQRHAHIDQRLRDDYVIWLHSTRPDGRPHAVVVWFLWDGGSVLIFSQPNKQKLRNIQHNPNILLAFDNSNNGSDPITIEGTAKILTHNEIDVTLTAYVQKYGAGIKSIGYTPEQMAAAYSQAIRITPTRVM